MKKGKSNLRNIKVAVLIQQARHIVTEMTGNAHFVTPIPALADITNKINALENAYEDSKSGSHAKKAEMHQLTKDLKHMISFITNYVNFIAQGDEQIILSSGLQLYKEHEKSGLLPAPADVHLSNGFNEGEVTVSFKKVNKAKSYEIEYFETNFAQSAQNPAQQTETIAGINLGLNLSEIPWKRANPCTKSKCIINKLTPTSRVIVRVAAVNSKGVGEWSDVATMVVP